jgi:4-hydroxybenzoate polyprenyltransferase
MTTIHHTPDSQHQGLVAYLPRAFQPYALLARFDRPIGWWLLFWPCAFGIALAGGLRERWDLLFWMLIGAIAMRGAGCVWNDMVDRDLDRQVARTASRPIASGMVSMRAAAMWAGALCLIGLAVLVQLPWLAQVVAVAYPFMKRITWWPQAWLGMVYSWGALVGWVAVGGPVGPAVLMLYAGCILWTIGYDTIYALQDIEDDALVGVKSSARAMGQHVRGGVAFCYTAALGLWGAAIWQVRPDAVSLVALLPITLHFIGQVATLDLHNGADALSKFRSNRFAGFLVLAAFAVVGSAF